MSITVARSSACKYVLWVNPGRQVSTTQPLAHLLFPLLVGHREEKGRVKAGKLMG